METKVIAEIGINHNGSVTLAKEMIHSASVRGCKYVKFQKRTPEICVPEEQKSKMRHTPWGYISYIDYKHKIEFGKKEYDEIFRYCEELGVECFASVWDVESVDFMASYTSIGKIPSALITRDKLVKKARESFDTLIISTGMSTEEEIEKAVQLGEPDILMHSVSSYPTINSDLNLSYLKHLQTKYPETSIGYSGHEEGIDSTVWAVALGAEWIERHYTLDHTMWGSDQLSSLEPHSLMTLMQKIKQFESAKGTKGPRKLIDAEIAKRKSLRG